MFTKKPSLGSGSTESQMPSILEKEAAGDTTPSSTPSEAERASQDVNPTKDATSEGDKFQEQPLSTVILLTTTSIMAMFLIALDRTIIVTAIPQITKEFNSLSDIGWYASAYLMTCGAFQLLFGKIYSMFNLKPVLLISIVLFEIGSAICGAAPTSTAFIVGRAVAGIGAAGILAGSVRISRYRYYRAMADTLSGCDGDAHRASREAAPDEWSPRLHFRHRHHSWAFDRRSFHVQCVLEMVLLHQPTHRWRCYCHSRIYHQGSKLEAGVAVLEPETMAAGSLGLYHAGPSRHLSSPCYAMGRPGVCLG